MASYFNLVNHSCERDALGKTEHINGSSSEIVGAEVYMIYVRLIESAYFTDGFYPGIYNRYLPRHRELGLV